MGAQFFKKIKLLYDQVPHVFMVFIYSFGLLYGATLIISALEFLANFPAGMIKEVSFYFAWATLLAVNHNIMAKSYFRRDVYWITAFLAILTIITDLIKFL